MRPLWLLLVAASCVRPGALDPANLVAKRVPPLTAMQRREYLRAAGLFEDIDVSERDLVQGPPGFREDQRVSCTFIEPQTAFVPPRGTTPKFFCILRHRPLRHDIVKVKYGRTNREVYGELLGSRLLWALGVAVDRDYAVRVRCHRCPPDPWISYRIFPAVDPSPRGRHEFDDAVLQRLYPGAILEEHADQGWSLDELAEVDAPRARVDALRLLLAFIAYGDDKPENQRLVCPFDALDDQQHCRAPRLLIADLGATFGRGANLFGLIDDRSRPTFAAWSALPVWKDRAACRPRWATRKSRGNPLIGEAGRLFLAARLAALSRGQIRDLFAAARIERLGETTRAGGTTRPVTVEDWALAFERRRAEILEARCPTR